MVVEELGARNAQVQETLADPLEVVQKMTQAGPHTFHRVTVHTRAVGVTTSIRARAMVDRPMVMVGLITALHQAQQGWAAHLGGGATTQMQPAWSRCAVVTCDVTGQPFAACTLVALIRFDLMLQLV